jgi:preprotein translocase subunit SecG
MFYRLLLILLFLDSIVLIAAVLLQAGQGGGMAATFGGVSSSTGAFFGTRQAGNLLTKASWWSGGLFLGLAFILSLSSAKSRVPRSVLDQAFPNAPVSAPAPVNAAPAAPLQTTPGGVLTPAPTPATKAPATKTPAGKAPSTTKKP